jgi:hypothetical protein
VNAIYTASVVYNLCGMAYMVGCGKLVKRVHRVEPALDLSDACRFCGAALQAAVRGATFALVAVAARAVVRVPAALASVLPVAAAFAARQVLRRALVSLDVRVRAQAPRVARRVAE